MWRKIETVQMLQLTDCIKKLCEDQILLSTLIVNTTL